MCGHFVTESNHAPNLRAAACGCRGSVPPHSLAILYAIIAVGLAGCAETVVPTGFSVINESAKRVDIRIESGPDVFDVSLDPGDSVRFDETLVYHEGERLSYSGYYRENLATWSETRNGTAIAHSSDITGDMSGSIEIPDGIRDSTPIREIVIPAEGRIYARVKPRD